MITLLIALNIAAIIIYYCVDVAQGKYIELFLRLLILIGFLYVIGVAYLIITYLP